MWIFCASVKLSQNCHPSIFRWLLLFLPFDALNKLIEMEVGGFQPFVLLLENVTTVRCIVSVDKGLVGL